MSSNSFSTVTFASFARASAVVAVFGAVMLARPPAPAFAQTAGPATSHQGRAAGQAETVEQRISALHAQLKITAAEEPEWQVVAQTMRDNAATMQKLAAEAEKSSGQGETAIEALETYTRFAEAHVGELKKLTASFQTLYNTMPDQQKKLADQVFKQPRG